MTVVMVDKPPAHYARDLDDDDQLDSDPEPLDFWAEKQKELVTNVVDYNLGALVDLISDGTINLNPTHQRRLRWDVVRQSKLIESFLMNVPVPPVFLNEDEYGQYSVIDGKQRLHAISSFLDNDLVLQGLRVFSDINGLRFNELPQKLRNVFKTRPTIRAIIILRQSDSDIKYEVFQRLNTGGAHLNPQEIRNNAYHGPLNTLIIKLSESRSFHSALGIRNKHRSAIYQEMRDAELVLRYFTFRNNWQTFKGGMKRAMDKYMDENRQPQAVQLAELEDDFNNALSTVTTVFGEHAFHRWVPERNDWRRHVLAALYDAQMFACREYAPHDLEPFKAGIVTRYKRLFEDEEFRKTIDAATNTPTLFKARIERLRSVLGEVATRS